MIDTDETLLDRVRSMDAHDAWREFYKEYWSAILRYARKLGLDETQQQDVLQETMVALMRVLPNFTYDRRKGRFRNFLLTIVHRQSLNALGRARRERATSAPWDDATGRHAGPAASDSLEPEARLRWQESVLEAVLDELARDPRLGRETLAVFRAYVIAGRPASEVAAEFGLKENAIYQIKNRLSRRVQAKVSRRLRDGDCAPA